MRIAADAEGQILCAMRDDYFRKDSFPDAPDQLLTFDDRTNAALANDVSQNTRSYSVSAGVLHKDGVAVEIATEHPDTWYAAKETSGITVGQFAGRWAIDNAARTAVSGQFLLASTAVNIGAALPDGPFGLTDADNTRYEFSLQALTIFGLQYGASVEAVLAEYRVRKAAYELSLLPPPEPEPDEPAPEGGE